MNDVDPIAMLAAQIKAKTAKAIAAGKTVVGQTAAKTTKKAPKQITIPDLYKGPRPKESALTTQRSKYLKSIESSLLKEAAAQNGITLKFGLKPGAEGWKTVDVLAHWDKIVQTMSALKTSQSATASIASTLGEAATATTPAHVDALS